MLSLAVVNHERMKAASPVDGGDAAWLALRRLESSAWVAPGTDVDIALSLVDRIPQGRFLTAPTFRVVIMHLFIFGVNLLGR